jgi:hypothetical protein
VSSVAAVVPGSTSTRVPLSAVAPEGSHSETDTDTHPPALGDMTTVTASTIPPAWKTTHRTTAGMVHDVTNIFHVTDCFSVVHISCWQLIADIFSPCKNHTSIIPYKNIAPTSYIKSKYFQLHIG